MPAKTTLQVRRDTSANWVATNPTLAAGEVGLDTTLGLVKVGTGSANWNALPYLPVADGSITTAKIASTASVNFVAGKRFIVQPTEPTAPVGGFGVGDVWISY